MMRVPLVRTALGAALVCGMGWSQAAAADHIELKDGTTVSGAVLGKDGQSVVIRVPRADVASVNGQALPPPVTAGMPAPAFTGVDLNGVPHTIPDASGRVTLVKFWATWCPHCRSDVPLVKDLATRYQQRGFQVLAVSIDQDVGKLQAFVREQQLPYPVIATHGPSVSTEQAGIPDRYEAQGVPAYYVIDRAGMIVQASSGSFVEGKRDLDSLITPLLPPAKTKKSAKP